MLFTIEIEKRPMMNAEPTAMTVVPMVRPWPNGPSQSAGSASLRGVSVVPLQAVVYAIAEGAIGIRKENGLPEVENAPASEEV